MAAMGYERPAWAAGVLVGSKGRYRRVTGPEPHAGANGIVYQAVDEANSTVAVKVFSPRDALSADETIALVKSFTNEVHKTRALLHWGIVQILDGGEHNGAPFTVLPVGAPEPKRGPARTSS